MSFTVSRNHMRVVRNALREQAAPLPRPNHPKQQPVVTPTAAVLLCLEWESWTSLALNPGESEPGRDEGWGGPSCCPSKQDLSGTTCMAAFGTIGQQFMTSAFDMYGHYSVSNFSIQTRLG